MQGEAGGSKGLLNAPPPSPGLCYHSHREGGTRPNPHHSKAAVPNQRPREPRGWDAENFEADGAGSDRPSWRCLQGLCPAELRDLRVDGA